MIGTRYNSLTPLNNLKSDLLLNSVGNGFNISNTFDKSNITLTQNSISNPSNHSIESVLKYPKI